ncbi:hypothetical protein [Glaciecola sp. 1036]|uniref:hypothetical protein n=1 Tax=Alteromonadaceae TaxID=72275 RepID=UPI003D06F925
MKSWILKICSYSLVTLSFVGFLHAKEPNPFVVYDDELKNGWVNHSWAQVEFSVPAGNAKPIKVSGKPWSALSLHHDAFDISQFTTLSFVINGGMEGGQTLAVKLISNGQPLESTYLIKPQTKQWQYAEISLADLGAQDQQVEGIWLQAQDKDIAAFYITRIEFR